MEPGYEMMAFASGYYYRLVVDPRGQRIVNFNEDRWRRTVFLFV